MEHVGPNGQLQNVCNPSLPIHTHPSLTSHPRFDGATAWLAAYTRTTPSPSLDGPPSAWSANECTPTTCSGEASACIESLLCFGPDGTCRINPFAAGTPCTDDGDATTNDQCDGLGACVHPSKCDGVVCPAAFGCLKASACFPTVGQCSLQVPRVGFPCKGPDSGNRDYECDGTGACVVLGASTTSDGGSPLAFGIVLAIAVLTCGAVTFFLWRRREAVIRRSRCALQAPSAERAPAVERAASVPYEEVDAGDATYELPEARPRRAEKAQKVLAGGGGIGPSVAEVDAYGFGIEDPRYEETMM